MHFIHMVFEPGWFSADATAFAIGGIVALASGVVGVFTVIRGQSFAGHALADVGTAGGAGAFLIGVNPLWGFIAIGLSGAAVMETFGIRRPRGRDVATGIVLGAALGTTALFLYLNSTFHNTTGAANKILFGSLSAASGAEVPIIIIVSAAILCVVAAFHRPLLLSSVSDDMAASRGVPVRTLGIVYLLVMSLSVSLSAVTIGAILSTALLIGPAAATLRVIRRPTLALASAGLVGVAATWIGILLSFDSYDWPPLHHGWPVSFFVVTLIFVFYLIAGAVGLRATRCSNHEARDPERSALCSPAS